MGRALPGPTIQPNIRQAKHAGGRLITDRQVLKKLSYGLDALVTHKADAGLVVVEVGPLWTNDLHATISKRQSGTFLTLYIQAPAHARRVGDKFEGNCPKSHIELGLKLPHGLTFELLGTDATVHNNVLVTRLKVIT